MDAVKTEPGMRIVKLVAENIKRLRAVAIEPTGPMTRITGRNGAGKTSVLDAVAYALGGAALIPSRPIRDGEETACVEVDLGTLKVRRRFTQKGSYLEVANADGAAYKSPQSILDKLCGTLTFDPLEFMRQAPRQQRDTLIAITGLSAPLAELDTERERAMDARKELHRTRYAKCSQLEALAPFNPDAPAEPVSIADLLQRLQAARAEVERNNAVQRSAAEAEEKVNGRRAALAQADLDIRALEARLRWMIENRAALAAEFEAANESRRAALDLVAALVNPDMAAIEQEIGTVESRNAAWRNNADRARIEGDIRDTLAQIERKNLALVDIESRKKALLEGATWPIAGLGFSADGVTFKGVPLEQASQAEQLRTSAAIAMALNPRLRVMLIRDGSLLDSTSLALLEEAARAADYQILIEQVGDENPGGSAVYIVDGEVADA